MQEKDVSFQPARQTLTMISEGTATYYCTIVDFHYDEININE